MYFIIYLYCGGVMKLIKYGTKDGIKYGLKDNGMIVVAPTYDTREELMKDPYLTERNNQTKKDEGQAR